MPFPQKRFHPSTYNVTYLLITVSYGYGRQHRLTINVDTKEWSDRLWATRIR